MSTKTSSTTKKKTAKKTVAKRVAKKSTKKPQTTKTTKKAAKKTVAKKVAAKPKTNLKVVQPTEKQIVEQVYNERNLSSGLESLSQSQHDEIRAMGEAMLRGERPQQKSIAKNAKQQAIIDSYSNIIQSTMDEIMNLSTYAPREDVLEVAHSNPQALVALRDAEAWTVHKLGAEYYLKTGINTIERVRDYVFKLEKVCLNYKKTADDAKLRVEEIQTSANARVDSLQKELDNVRNQGFWSLIKLAFAGLFKGENNG